MRQSKKSKKIKKFRKIGNRKYHIAVFVLFIALALGGIFYRSSNNPKLDTASAAATPDTCLSVDQRTQNAFPCYKKVLNGLIQKQGAESAVAFLKAHYDSSSFISTNCHQLMHVIGRTTFAKYGNLPDAFAHGDQFCWAGFYHGIIEDLALQKGYDYIYNNANTICQPIADKYGPTNFNTYNCVHGMGHGFMIVDDSDLFKSLSSCDRFDGSWNQNSCYGGVFMQNVMNVQGPDAKPLATYPYLRSAEPMYPCTAVDDRYKGSCYLMQTSFALQMVGYDFSKVFSLCAGIEQVYTSTCYQSLGRDASGSSTYNIEQARTTCLLGPSQDAQSNCVIGAVKDFISYYHSDKQAYEFCDRFPSDISKTCDETAKSYYANFN